jgi:glycine dehydrogenase subunit 1
MDFIANKDEQNRAMLQEIGVESVQELFSAVPKSILLKAIQQDDGMSEWEGMRLAETMAEKNLFPKLESYLGAGAYEHHIPPLVAAICQKSEFLTSYTPYQPEASQGMLQSIFEYQSAICALTGMDVANASVYDAASSVAEACLMALRIYPDRKKIAVSQALHPHYQKVLELYLSSHLVEIVKMPMDDQMKTSQGGVDNTFAACVLQSPNFFGVMEKKFEAEGPLNILVANPLAYGIFSNALECGADVAVGDSQPFGLPLQFGGPYAGYMACKTPFVRQLPGRIVGMTNDAQGRRGFVLTLQAREQHIRREKATSNICTNQALAALASLVAILWYGKQGVKELALTNFQRACYLKEKLQKMGCTLLSDGEHFNEFGVKFTGSKQDVLNTFRQAGIEPGVDLGQFFPDLDGFFLVCVTETKSKEMLDRYVSVLKSGRIH